jgi:LysR family transcriptional regulator, cys regulon transcriptional activator
MAIEAIDSDVIKTYVRAGLGVGIVAEMAVNAELEKDLVVKPAGHLFGKNVARVAFKRSAYLRNFIYTFTELISERLTRDVVSKALAGYSDDYSL